MAGQCEVQSAQVVAYFVAKSMAEIVAQAVACVVLPRLMIVEAEF